MKCWKVEVRGANREEDSVRVEALTAVSAIMKALTHLNGQPRGDFGTVHVERLTKAEWKALPLRVHKPGKP